MLIYLMQNISNEISLLEADVQNTNAWWQMTSRNAYAKNKYLNEWITTDCKENYNMCVCVCVCVCVCRVIINDLYTFKNV
jgi:hypothetical protein